MMAVFKRIFSRMNQDWHFDPIVNEIFLKEKKGYYDALLNNRGYVFLKDIYSDLGYPITQKSLTFGWVKSEKDKRIRMDIIPVSGSLDLELAFECDSILDHFPKELNI